MCGIAGIMYRGNHASFETGDALIRMLDGCQHRGPDSTGFALYTDSQADQLRLRFFVGEETTRAIAIDRIQLELKKYGAKIIEDEQVGNNYRALVEFHGDVKALAYALQRVTNLISVGTSLEIVKDVGVAHEVDATFDVRSFRGTHGLGHVRLATESDVKPEAAHPFWATGFSDVAIVHNGQITNYWKMRRRLEQREFEFTTDNDSELIAV